MRDERKGLRLHLKEKMGVPEEELNRFMKNENLQGEFDKKNI